MKKLEERSRCQQELARQQQTGNLQQLAQQKYQQEMLRCETEQERQDMEKAAGMPLQGSAGNSVAVGPAAEWFAQSGQQSGQQFGQQLAASNPVTRAGSNPDSSRRAAAVNSPVIGQQPGHAGVKVWRATV